MSTFAKPGPSRNLDPDLRSALIAMVRKRVPESEVEDIVQQALAEAIESPHAPQDSESLRRWIFGVAKNKVVDYHRRAGRESFDLPDVEGTPAPHVEADLLRWAEKNLPEGAENKKTLDWMLREGEGEKLESIAESEKLPPPRVRQRVSRLRRHFKENWQREVAMLAALGVIVSAIVIYVLRKPDVPGGGMITHDVVDPRAEPMRRLALEKCASGDWKPCVDGLDEARHLDPAGHARPDVQQARDAAANALKLQPAPSPSPSPSPSSSSDLSPTPPPTPSPMDSAPPLDMKMKGPPPKPPSKTNSIDSLSTPPAPTSVPTAAPTPVPTAEPTAQQRQQAKPVAKPQGKRAAPSKAGGSSDFTPDPSSDGDFGSKK